LRAMRSMFAGSFCPLYSPPYGMRFARSGRLIRLGVTASCGYASRPNTASTGRWSEADVATSGDVITRHSRKASVSGGVANT
jgi:hypothetical protein